MFRLRFDGSPGPEPPRFVEAEDGQGRGVSIGRWEKDPESTDWFLILSEPEPLAVVEVEGWIAEEDIKPFDGLFQIWARDALLHTAGHIPVTAILYERRT